MRMIGARLMGTLGKKKVRTVNRLALNWELRSQYGTNFLVFVLISTHKINWLRCHVFNLLSLGCRFHARESSDQVTRKDLLFFPEPHCSQPDGAQAYGSCHAPDHCPRRENHSRGPRSGESRTLCRTHFLRNAE